MECAKDAPDGNGCVPETNGTDHQTITLDHGNSLSAFNTSKFLTGSGIYGVAGMFHVHAPDAWTARVIHFTWLLADGGSASAGSAVGVGSPPLDDVDIPFGGYIPPTKGGTLIATLDSCGDRFSSAAVDADGDHQCDGCEPHQPPGCQNCVGRPIRLDDGNMQITQIDPLPAFGGVGMKRTYDSDGPSLTWFGTGWSSIFDRALTVYPNVLEGPWAVLWLNGTKRYVFREVSGNWVQMWPLGRQQATLVTDGATGAYTLREPERDIEVVIEPQDGLPVTYRSRSTGRALSISYSGTTPVHVSDSWGTFGWTINTSGHRVDSISIDGTSLNWQYVYNGSLLTGVNGPGAATWRTYSYSSNRLTEARDSAGKLLESHAYGAFGRATTSLQAENDIQSITYGAATRSGAQVMTRVTSTSGAVTNYWVAYYGGRARTVEIEGNCASCGVNNAVFAYKPSDYTQQGGQLLRMQDARGYITEWTYDSSDRVTAVTNAYKPAACDPETDASRCHQSPESLLTVALAPTPATQTTMYVYGDGNWIDRPTVIARSSVSSPGQAVTELLTYDATTGAVLTDTRHGWNGTQPETHVTTTVLYDGSEGAAFNPGGAFDSAWMTLAQPAGLRKSSDGPRTDVADITQWAYYPVSAAVPAFWRGRVAAVRDAAGHSTRFENYDVFGNPGRIVDPNDVVTEYTYDAIGRALTSTLKGVSGCDTSADPLCATDLTTTRTYQSTYGPLASETRSNGATTTYEYDTRGRLKAIVRPVSASLFERLEHDYDPATGKKSAERYLSGQPGAWIQARSEAFRYDTFGRLFAIDHPDGKSVFYAYDAANNVATVQDENHLAPNTAYQYDPVNRLIRVTQTLASASGGTITTQYAYDLHGNLTSVTDPNGNATTYAFDDFGRMKQQVSPVTATTTYTYDAAGNLTSTTDANNATSTRTYDPLNRVASAVSTKGSQSETVSWTYDETTPGQFGIGRLASMTDPTGSTTYQYERRGLLRTEAKSIFGATYTTRFGYDTDGNRSSMTYPSGRLVTYGYDLADRPLSAISGGTTYVSSAAYLPFGPMTQLVYGNGTTKTMQYDTRYRPLKNKLTGPSGVIADYNYLTDGAGNITQIHDAVDPTYNRDFGYDDLNRLTAANSGSSLWGNGSYAYDRMGNMQSLTLGTSRSASFGYSGTLPKLATVTENGVSRAVSYDAAGNEATVGSGSFAYTPRNSLENGDSETYAYDGRGVRTVTSLPAYYLTSLSLTAATLYTNQSTSGTVTLGAPAPSGGATVQLSASSTAILVPASVTIPVGGTSGVFGVNQAAGAQPGSVTITATYGFARTGVVTLTAGPALSSVAVAPTSVIGGNTATGTVTLAAAAPAGGAPVSLSSDSSAVVVPSSVTVAAGSTSASFTVTTSAVATATTATVQGLYSNAATASLTVQTVSLVSLTLDATSVMGGHPVTGTISLGGPAPTGGVSVALTSANAQLVVVPAAVTVPVGASSQTFTVTTAVTSTDTSVLLTATLSGQSTTATLGVTHCITAHAAAPTIPGGDTVWIDDGIPSGAAITSWSNGPAQWSTSQAASGTQSLLHAWVGAVAYGTKISSLNVRAEIGESAVVHVWMNECLPPSEIKVRWGLGPAGPEGSARWGANVLAGGSIDMGPLPAAGQWARLVVPFALFGFEDKTIEHITLEAANGQVAFDHIGKSGTACIAAHAAAPTIPSEDTVWIEDGIPSGATMTNQGFAAAQWSTSQAASATQSLLYPWLGAGTYTTKISNLNVRAEIGESAVLYVWMNECAPPSEIKVRWGLGPVGPEGAARWGANVIAGGSIDRGPLPAAGQWARLEVPFALFGFEDKTIEHITVEVANGQVAFDHIGKSGTACIAAHAAAPTIPSGDTVWIEDGTPSGATMTNMGTAAAQWSTSQAASATQSLLYPWMGAGTYSTKISNLNVRAEIGESAVVYVWMNECAPPSEIKVRWGLGPVGPEGAARWGANVIAGGSIDRGPLPAAGQWARLEVPFALFGFEDKTIEHITVEVANGQVAFDHVGKSGTACIAAHAGAPTIPSGDTVWIEDGTPNGATMTNMGTAAAQWSTSQAASATQSLLYPWLGAGTYSTKISNLNVHTAIGESAVVYVWMNECAPPSEIQVRWGLAPAGPEALLRWGANVIGGNSINMGALPPAGQWVRLEVPFALFGFEDKTIEHITLETASGQLAFDHIGKSGPPAAVLTSFSAAPTSPQAVGTTITFSASATAYVAPAQYRFERQDIGTWSTVQAYSATSSYTWTPASGDAGEHFVRVSVRNAGSLLDFEDTQTLSYTVTGGSGLLQHPAGRVLLALRRIFQRPEPPVSLAVGARLAFHSTSAPVGFNRYSLYTPELNLMAETETTMSSTPVVAHEYIWFAGQPVAQVDIQNSATHWTFTDYLGTPILQTDPVGGIDWRAEHDPYGNVFVSRAGTARHQPLRFPGQESDGSGERSYNIFRWYRGGWGRYTQPDPITIGSISHPPMGMPFLEAVRRRAELLNAPMRQHTYAYGGDSPMNSTDPDGQYYVPPCVARAANRAFAESNATGLPGRTNGPRDALRHCLWSCYMSKDCGQAMSGATGWAHEILSLGPMQGRGMDVANNAEGRDCGSLVCSCESCCTGKKFFEYLEVLPQSTWRP